MTVQFYLSDTTPVVDVDGRVMMSDEQGFWETDPAVLERESASMATREQVMPLLSPAAQEQLAVLEKPS